MQPAEILGLRAILMIELLPENDAYCDEYEPYCDMPCHQCYDAEKEQPWRNEYLY
jgi:hypothetical protein